MLVIPAIDLRKGHCVRLTQGRKDDVKVYDADPLAVATRFKSAGTQLIHLVDLDGAFTGTESASRSVALRIIESGVAIEFGGGLRTIADVQELIDLGAARVVVGTLAAESPEILGELARNFGARICVGIDAREGMVMVRGWEHAAEISAVDLACRVANAGIRRIIYTDIVRDGTLTGPNVEQTRVIARASGLRVTASGGVSSLDDIKRLIDAGEPLVDSVIIGKALYEGRFSIEEALSLSQQGD